MIPAGVTHCGLFRIPDGTGGIRPGVMVQWIENATDTQARGICKALEATRGWVLVDTVRFVTQADVERITDIAL